MAADDIEILYGLHTAGEALKNPKRKFVRLLATKNAAARLANEIALAGLKPIESLPRDLDKLTGADAVHQGIVVEARPLKQPRLDQIARGGIVVMLDQVTDPHNVGAIMRSCAAFAVTALVATARHSPQGSGVLFKAASGAYEHVPFVKVTNLVRAMEELRGYGFRLIGLAGDADRTIEEIDRTPPLALILGAEGRGLRQLTRRTCDALARLDLPGEIRSLNVSVAAAVTLHALKK
jgi:23S rRNA (guanosine2251-2'-O)-methyltransferase